MELPKRKPNRIPHFDYSAPGAYFVTICTQDKAPLLSTVVGGGALDAPDVRLSRNGEISQKNINYGKPNTGVTVDIYVIMPNLIHLILLVEETATAGTSRAPSPTNAVIPHFVSTL